MKPRTLVVLGKSIEVEVESEVIRRFRASATINGRAFDTDWLSEDEGEPEQDLKWVIEEFARNHPEWAKEWINVDEFAEHVPGWMQAGVSAQEALACWNAGQPR